MSTLKQAFIANMVIEFLLLIMKSNLHESLNFKYYKIRQNYSSQVCLILAYSSVIYQRVITNNLHLSYVAINTNRFIQFIKFCYFEYKFRKIDV